MQNVPIKFRGKCVDSGEYVCGDLIHGEDGICIIINDDRHRVDENSIVQLVGYDKEGNEIYDGEELITFKPDITAKAVIIKQINFFRNADENNVVFSNAFYPELANVWNLVLKK